MSSALGLLPASEDGTGVVYFEYGDDLAASVWLRIRPEVSSPALFVNTAGGRLSVRAIDRGVRAVGQLAGLALSAHVLLHTFVTLMVRSGVDVVMVAELAGHRSLETTRRYSLPTEADREAAVELAAITS